VNQVPLGRAPVAGDAEPLLPLAFTEHVELIRSSNAVSAFCRSRAAQILTHGHTPEANLEKSIAEICDQARWRLQGFWEFAMPYRMNLPPERRSACIRQLESAGGILISLWDRVHVEVPEE
jgi:hypothetical protein